jgi:hypothetical protein
LTVQPAYFSPHTALASASRALGCHACRYFQGRILAQHVVCEHRGAIQVMGAPRMGCAYWEREPGADDE